jgi:hypothetical protein
MLMLMLMLMMMMRRSRRRTITTTDENEEDEEKNADDDEDGKPVPALKPRTRGIEPGSLGGIALKVSRDWTLLLPAYSLFLAKARATSASTSFRDYF